MARNEKCLSLIAEAKEIERQIDHLKPVLDWLFEKHENLLARARVEVGRDAKTGMRKGH